MFELKWMRSRWDAAGNTGLHPICIFLSWFFSDSFFIISHLFLFFDSLGDIGPSEGKYITDINLMALFVGWLTWLTRHWRMYGLLIHIRTMMVTWEKPSEYAIFVCRSRKAGSTNCVSGMV